MREIINQACNSRYPNHYWIKKCLKFVHIIDYFEKQEDQNVLKTTLK